MKNIGLKVDFIKIDTQKVPSMRFLTKSVKTMKQFRPAIYYEPTRKKDKIRSLLAKYGYEFFTISNEEKHKVRKNFNSNILALHKKSSYKKM